MGLLKKSTLLMVAFAIALRVAAAFWWQAGNQPGELFRFGDSHTYWVLASQIAHGLPYEYGGPGAKIFRAPLYPLWLAPWTLVADASWGVLASRLSGCILGGLCVFICIRAAERLGGRIAGIFAGLCAALYPGAIGMSVFILSEALFCPLMLGALYAWSRARENSADHPDQRDHQPFNILGCQFRWSVFSGLLTGLACLSRPSFFLWAAWLGFASLAFGPSRRRAATCWVVFILGLVIVMSPWWVRNYWITGRFVPTTLQVGASLYDGWHPGATGLSDEDMRFAIDFGFKQLAIDNATEGPLESTFEYRLNERMFQAAWRWALQNPSDVIRLGLIKFGRTWSPWPSAHQIGSRWVRWTESVGYAAIGVLGLIGWWHYRKRGWSAHLYAHPCIYFGMLHTVFIGSVRYRQPAILALCVLAGCGVEWLIHKIRNR